MVCLILVSLFVWLRTSDSGEFAKQFSSQQKDNLVNVQLGQSGKIESNSACLLLDFLLNLVLISISLWSWSKPASGESILGWSWEVVLCHNTSPSLSTTASSINWSDSSATYTCLVYVQSNISVYTYMYIYWKQLLTTFWHIVRVMTMSQIG